MGLKAVLFDLWGTLIIDTPARGRPRQVWRTNQVLAVLAQHGLEPEFDFVDKALQSSMLALTALQDDGRDLDGRGRALLLRHEMERQGFVPFPDAALPAVEQAICGLRPDLSPDVEPFALAALTQVKQLGLATGLVSNAGFTTSPALRALISDLGLLPYLDTLVFSDEIGAAKPHPSTFNAALEALKLGPSECAFVGDSPHNDVAGAQALGMFAVQIGPRRREGITPEMSIEDMSGLLPALQTRGLLPRAGAAPSAVE